MNTFRPWTLVLLAAVCLPAQPQTAEPPPAVVVQATTFLPGQYACEGRNVDGTPYRGMVMVVARSDGRFEFLWRIGAFHRGIGSVQGAVVTVDFGDAFPVIYEIGADGSLSGTWANGHASERLTPIGSQRT